MTTHLRKNDLAITIIYTKNMRRNIGKCFGDKSKFFTWKERLYVYYAKIEEMATFRCTRKMWLYCENHSSHS